MSGALVATIGAAGLVVGAALPVLAERIPTRHPLRAGLAGATVRHLRSVEGVVTALVTGALFAGLALRIGGTADLVAYLVLAAGLVLLTRIDVEQLLLPNRVVGPLTVAVVVPLAVAAVVEDAGGALFRALATAVISFLVFVVLHAFSPRGMGFGDVKLSFVLGAALGWLGAGEAVVGFLLAFVLGAIVGLGLVVTRVRGRHDHVPFGPFLAAGTLAAVLAGQSIVDWYRG